MTRLIRLLSVAILVAAADGAALAQTFYTWNGQGGDALWSNSGNWNSGLKPVVNPLQTDSVFQLETSAAVLVTTNDTGSIATPLQFNQMLMMTGGSSSFYVGGGAFKAVGSGALIQRQVTGASFLQINSAINFSVATTLDAGAAAPVLPATDIYYEMVLGGLLTGGGSITRSGADLLITGVNNDLTGTWTQSSAITYLGGANALGPNVAVNLTGSGATIRSFTIQTGPPTQTNIQQIRDSSGALVTPGNVGYDQQIGSFAGASGSTLNNGNATASTAATIMFNKNVTTSTTMAGQMSSSSVNAQFAKVGSGTFNITGSQSNGVIPIGGLSVRDGALVLSGGGRFTAANNTAAGAVSVYAGATVRLDNSSTNQTDRLANEAAIRLSGGTLVLVGASSGTNTSEIVGSFVLTAGQSTIEIGQGTSTGGGAITTNRAARFSAYSFTQSAADPDTATAFIRATNLSSTLPDTSTSGVGTGSITIGLPSGSTGTATQPALIGGTDATNTTSGITTLGILPFLVGADTSNATAPTGFVTYVGFVSGSNPGTSRFRLLNSSTEYAASFDADTTTKSNVGVASATLGAASFANSLLITGTNIDLNGNNLTLNAGALLNTGTGNITNGGAAAILGFGTATAGVANGDRTAYITNNSDMSIAANITVKASNLSKNGAGNLTVNGVVDLSGASGDRAVAVNAGTLTLNGSVSTGTLGANAMIYQVSRGATLATSGLTIGPNTVLQGGGTQAANGTSATQATVTGNVTVASGGVIRPSSLSGNYVAGTGSPAAFSSPAVLTLTGATTTFQGGGTYEWSFNSVLTTADAGSGFRYYTQSLLYGAGQLDVGADAGNRFTVKMVALNLSNTSTAAGPMSIYDYDPVQTYSFTIATFDGGINGFSSSKFTVDTSAFANNGGQTWTVIQSGNNLVLTNAVVPEPATSLLIAAACLGTFWIARRRSAAIQQAA